MPYSGQSIRRFEDPTLITGQGAFVEDFKLPGMLHAAVIRSPFAHARIRSVDTSPASNLPGVVSVLTANDIGGILPTIPTRVMDGERSLDSINAPEHPVLADGVVCYVGQAVAIVVAQDPYLARDAAELIQVDYEPLPPVIDPFLAMKEDSPAIHQDMDGNVAMRVRQQGGDLEAAFAKASHVVEQTYHSQRIAPAPMETRGVVADYQPGEDLLTVWNSTQAPQRLRTYLSRLLGRPESGFRVIAPDVGGSFGLKDCMFPEDFLVPYLSLILERPVKWIEDRQENMLAYHGRGQSLELKVAVDSQGLILGMRVLVVADLGAYFLFTTPSAPFNACRRITGPYRIPAMDVELRGVITNKTPTGAFRGTGGPESAFAMERTMDLIANDLGLDPAEVRRRNFIAPDEFPHQTATGSTYDSGNYEEGFARSLELADYSSWRQRARQSATGDMLIGVGLATILKSSGSAGAHRTENARVAIDPSGQVSVYTGISPHGQGNETSFAQIVADELGVDPAQVRVFHGDTSIVPEGEGTSASRGLIVGGSALYSVLQDARQKLMLVASHLLSCPVDDVRWEAGRFYSRHTPNQGMALEQVTAAAYDGEVLPVGMDTGLDFHGTYSLPGTPFSFAAHVVVVEVNRDSGHVNILRYVGVHDCGRIVNPMLVDGQIHGGIAQGIGQALTEGMVYSDDGQPLNGSLLDYAVPRASLIPDLLLDNVDTPSPTNPLGAKGVGSVSTVPSPVAVANAVLDALSGMGVRHMDTPLTPEKIWRAIHDAQGSKG
ncbi:MAG: xanthine dehydrogenase family protein molybdopterin-binding subunit [Chloroflexi bacterium]|nr:xanthine dehydrogenase family protein molybdopterin-binding subunit [Chloroflexota bacterium]MCI0794582.1 xanthine dehydrogenase family protein molybdopterin-binding subunit [Chloroflexota bacterium]